MQHKRIPLRNASGETVATVLVDAEDAERFGRWHWHLHTAGYAARMCKRRGRIYLHREILGLAKGDGRMADHINRDRLDCRRANLRIVTPGQNNQNRGPWERGSSGVRGVSWHKGTRKWRVHVNGKHFGLFADIEEAKARAIEVRRSLLTHAND